MAKKAQHGKTDINQAIKMLQDMAGTSKGFFDDALKNPMMNAVLKDAYINMATGAGTGIDKNTFNRYVSRAFLDPQEMSDIYTNSWIGRTTA